MNMSLFFLFASHLVGEFNGVFELVAWKVDPLFLDLCEWCI